MKIWFLFPIWVAILAYVFCKIQDEKGTHIPESVKADTTGDVSTASVGSPSTEEDRVRKKVPREIENEPNRPWEPLSGDAFNARVRELSEHLSLLPVAEDANPVSFLWPVDVDGPALPELMEIARRESFPKWKPYEDEWIRFYYPDDEAISLNVFEGGAAFPMLGETMWTVRQRPFRTYVLRTGAGTFCVIALERTTAFDDTKRSPGEEVYRQFFHNGGALGRASFMEDGQIRRVQYVGSDIRASVHDWPHLAIHQDVYRSLSLGIRLNRPPVDRDKLEAAVLGYYGFSGGLGLIRRGMTLNEMEPFLGSPTGVTDGLAVYHRGRDASDCYYRLNLEGDTFTGFGEKWCEPNPNPPIRGSVDWVLEKTEVSAGSTGGSRGYSLGVLTDEDVDFIFDRFCELAPTAGAVDWKKLCRAIANLAEMKVRDDRILPLIRSRFMEEDLPMSHAIQVLHNWDRDGSRDDFASRIRKIIQMSRWAKKDVLDSSGPLNADLQILIAYLGREDERTPELILQAMDHRMADVRGIAYSYWPWLEEDECIDKLLRGLSDESAQVRRRCAEAFCENCGTLAEHGALLENCLVREKDGETRNYIALALERLRKSATLKVEAEIGS